MGIRTSVAALMSITVLFVGAFAISESAQQTKPTLNSTSANQSYDLSVEVFGGVMQTGGQGIIWFGVAAIVLVAMGLLVMAGQSGGR